MLCLAWLSCRYISIFVFLLLIFGVLGTTIAIPFCHSMHITRGFTNKILLIVFNNNGYIYQVPLVYWACVGNNAYVAFNSSKKKSKR